MKTNYLQSTKRTRDSHPGTVENFPPPAFFERAASGAQPGSASLSGNPKRQRCAATHRSPDGKFVFLFLRTFPSCSCIVAARLGGPGWCEQAKHVMPA